MPFDDKETKFNKSVIEAVTELFSNDKMFGKSVIDSKSHSFEDAWLPVLCTTTLLICGTLWLTASLIKYGVQYEKWKSTRQKSNPKILLSLAVLSTIMTLCTMVLTQAITLIGKLHAKNEIGDKACEISMDVSIVFFYLSIIPVYFFLWYRQKMLYAQPSLMHLNTKVVKFFSYSFILLILFGGGFSTVIFIIPLSFNITASGCVRSHDQAFNYLPNYLAASILVLSQFILFGLFCYPLRMHKIAINSMNKEYRGNPNMDTEKRLMLAIRSATVSMGVCIISDLMAMVLVALILPENLPGHCSSAFYDLSLFVNIMSITFSFKDHKKIIRALFVGDIQYDRSLNRPMSRMLPRRSASSGMM